MPAPLLVPLILLGGATIALAAASSKKKPKDQPSPPGRTYTLDANMPPQLRDQVLAALATESDPNKLEAFAAAIAPNYPLSAAALRVKEAIVRSQSPQPSPLPQPAPSPQPVPTPSPTPPPLPTPTPPPLPTPDWQTQLLTVPDPPRTQVIQALMSQSDPSALEAYARQLDGSYPVAAWVLRVKEATILGQAPPPMPSPLPSPAPSPVPQPIPPPGVLPPTPPAPAPTPGPTPYLGGLDPGMPIEMQKAVVGALTTETDPAKLEGFASAIQGQYPVAAGLLMAKAQALRLVHPQPAPGPSPLPIPVPTPVGPTPIGPPVPPYPVPPVPGSYPIGDDSTRSGRNAGRPAGYPFILLHGESTYPAKISKQATGTEANYPQMSKINPQFAKDGVHWINIQTGDALNIPWDWAPKLAALYRIQIDPGVTPPVYGLPPAAAPAMAPTAVAAAHALPPAGGSHAAHA